MRTSLVLNTHEKLSGSDLMDKTWVRFGSYFIPVDHGNSLTISIYGPQEWSNTQVIEVYDPKYSSQND